jgi:hypothetical protein
MTEPITNTTINNITQSQSKIKTEDTGKEFEMAICTVCEIPYNGPYKYTMELAELLKDRLVKIKSLFPNITHTAEKGARYDFTASDPTDLSKFIHLSAKTSKKGIGKVAPQVIGQAQPQNFCDIIGQTFTDIPILKQYIQENIIQILSILSDYTFDCPNIYFRKDKNTLKYIILETPIDWNKYEYIWTCDYNNWKNSTTLKIREKIDNQLDKKYIPILEFQIHTKSRTNMAIRWFYDNILDIFSDSFRIQNL